VRGKVAERLEVGIANSKDIGPVQVGREPTLVDMLAKDAERDEPAPPPPPPLVIPPPPWSEHYQDELDDPARSSYPAPRQTKPKPTPNRDEVRGWREEDA
jgi:hypothetical protein